MSKAPLNDLFMLYTPRREMDSGKVVVTPTKPRPVSAGQANIRWSPGGKLQAWVGVK
ncbi:hypothetical protein V0M98_37110 (plasmid) [Pseudomonas silesiensis]|uniref:hypothetical protein n=1 Tax=Pseudomonas silesiensis TaxID=1853130 RepID=UPI0030CB8E94